MASLITAASGGNFLIINLYHSIPPKKNPLLKGMSKTLTRQTNERRRHLANKLEHLGHVLPIQQILKLRK